MVKAIELMKRREEEILKSLLILSKKTKNFSKPELILIGGYALRAFISFSRFTRDCDFALRKENGWNIDKIKEILPEGYCIEEEQKHGSYGFLRCTKFLKYNKVKIKVSMDLMEGEIRGREAKEIVIVDEAMIRNRRFVSIPIGGSLIKLPVPDYRDYFILKVISARASDVRDLASLVHENGVPFKLKERIKEILPYPEIFLEKLQERVIPEMKNKNFLNSWRGIFGTIKYREEDKERVIEKLEKLI